MTEQRDYMKESWFALLVQKIQESCAAVVARELGYSSTAVSLVVSGKYNGKTDKIAQKVQHRYTQVHCPYSGRTIELHVCAATANGKAPMHNPLKMAQWKACQSCCRKPSCDKA